jgi:ATP-dependent protease ClpP protease subunit
VALVGEIFDENEKDIVQALLEVDPGANVSLYIDSSGGNVYAAMAIANIILHRRLKATAIVVGECSSSAILVFAACPKRQVGRHSVFLFHRIKWRSEKDARSEEAAQWASHFQWLEQEVDELQAKWLGVPTSKMKTWIAEGRFVVGQELVDLGAADLVDFTSL